MKSLKLTILSLITFFTVNAQDVVYSTFIQGENIGKININPITGATSGGFTNVKSIIPSAALGASIDGWLYYLEYGSNSTGSEDGKVDIWATRTNGIGSPVKVASNYDLNGASNKDLGFVRLGITINNVAYIIAKETSDNTIYLTKFAVFGSTNVSPTNVGTLNTSDGTNSLFENGDLAFDGMGTLYALANNGAGSTKIYTVQAAQLNSATSSSTTILQYKWTLKTSDGEDFDNRVNGCAFASAGSMYISSDNGLYFINQSTINFNGLGTVLCTKVKSQSDITDLATGYWPAKTALPVKITKITLTLSYDK